MASPLTAAGQPGIERHLRHHLDQLLAGQPEVTRDAGLIDVRARPIVYLDEPGHPRRSLLSGFVDNLRGRLLARGLVTRDELDALHGALRRHREKPDTIVASQLFVQAWERRPG